MKCLRPIDIKNKKNPKLGFLTVPCGKCASCLSNKRNEWTFRLEQELKVASTAKFITMTYAENTVPITQYGELQLNKKDIQLFFKKLRNENKKLSDEQIRYYMVGEYGTKTSRPHYHILLFNADSEIFRTNPEKPTKIEQIWNKGQLDIGTITSASIHYVTKYVITKSEGEYSDKQPPFALMSRRPAIGHNYLIKNTLYHQASSKFYVRSPNGTKQSIPRYYNNKIFTDEERTKNTLKGSVQTHQLFSERISKLRKSHSDPYSYIKEQEEHFENKSKQNDKKQTL